MIPISKVLDGAVSELHEAFADSAGGVDGLPVVPFSQAPLYRGAGFDEI